MKKKIKIKIISSIFIFILGTIASIYISVYLHVLLSDGEFDLNIFKIQNLIQIIKDNLKALKLFGCFELMTLLISLFFISSKDKFYESDLIQITPNISIPVEAGQKQFGSARFMTEKEKEKIFTVLEIKQDKNIINYLLKHGYDDLEEEGEEDI